MFEYVFVCANMHACVPMLRTSIKGLGQTGPIQHLALDMIVLL